MTDLTPIEKTALLAAMQQGWDETNAFLDTLTETQASQPTDAGGWAVKDHVIHLAAWEGSMNGVLQRQPRHEAIGVSEQVWMSGGIDGINDVLFQRDRHLSWAEVRRQFAAQHQELVGRISLLSEVDLQRPYSYYQPSLTHAHPMSARLAIASCEHYAEHMPWMRAIAAQGDPMTDPTAIDKATLLANMQSGWNELLAFIATLTPDQQSIPTDAAGWAVKDHLIHLAVWQEGVLAMFDGRSRIDAMSVPQPAWDTRDFDQINAVIFQNHRDKSIDEVLQILHATQDRFAAKVASMSEADYQRPNPDSPAGTRMIQYIISDSYEHYADHIRWMQAIVANHTP